AMCRWTSVNGLTVYLREATQESREAEKWFECAWHCQYPELIQPAFDEMRRLAERRPFYDIIEGFFDYVQWTWLDDIGSEQISVYRRVQCTNNDLENYHRTLVDTLGRPHGSAWVWM
ncbi:putative GPI-anchored protein 17, partial [Frankliniella fusca]